MHKFALIGIDAFVSDGAETRAISDGTDRSEKWRAGETAEERYPEEPDPIQLH